LLAAAVNTYADYACLLDHSAVSGSGTHIARISRTHDAKTRYKHAVIGIQSHWKKGKEDLEGSSTVSLGVVLW